ncbi:MAG: GIY-YIG nuclease family protein [Desulfuromonadales bacterium]
MEWHVYIILCSDTTYYTGITSDIERRVRQHAKGTGAKYFRGRKPEQVVYLEKGHNRSSASRREIQIKSMSRAAKENLIMTTSAADLLKLPL